MAKKRVDLLLVERGLADTRQKAQAVVMAGQVYTGERRCDKPGLTLEEDAPLEVRGGLRYVSRGGLKLEKAMEVFPIALADKTAADIGASTGGFTDCMLQNGAKRVYAVDVGYGQLAWSIRSDPRVVCLERTLSDPGTDSRAPGFRLHRRVLHLTGADPARPAATDGLGGSGRRPGEAPV